ncbi:FMN-binding protein [Flammeovirga agarivorans]|uniref:Ion-translocating oxidoreductase complex subunit G n=1 Tax=Flammeovirga agarivorans TaxID=2726742 RepID=A0A7X8SK92_9BACT|nr:FMN-binding protein [Flammeovirga agarivorans]NLR91781.1 FMN-binding protein [Flammeovirga agarivorans]
MNAPSQPIPQEDTPKSGKMLSAMVGLGLLCALLIVSIYEGTSERRAFLKAEALEKAIFQVIPNTKKMEPMLIENGTLIPFDQKKQGLTRIYVGYNDEGNMSGYALECSGQGYADIIKILIGYDPKTETVVGFHVLESKETPGLGDKIEKDENFLANFIALDVSWDKEKKQLNNAVITVKNGEKNHPWEIDGITGATISSRAIGKIINDSMEKVNQ